MIRKVALVVTAFFLCSGSMCAHRQTEPQRGIIVAGLDRELANQCIGRIRRSDVPVVPEGHTRPLDSAQAEYTRKLEDGYELCERVVREGVAAGNVQ